jgi:hypothetical protein
MCGDTLHGMPASQMPDHRTKISYIVEKRDKAKLERAARKSGLSMIDLITGALVSAGILPKRRRKAA